MNLLNEDELSNGFLQPARALVLALGFQREVKKFRKFLSGILMESQRLDNQPLLPPDQ